MCPKDKMSPQSYVEHRIDPWRPSMTTLNSGAPKYPCVNVHVLTSIQLFNDTGLSLLLFQLHSTQTGAIERRTRAYLYAPP